LSDIIQPAEAGQKQADPLKVLTYLIEYNKMIYKFHGLSLRADFNTYYSSFQNTMKNFKILTDQAKINKQPALIKIVEAKKKTSLQQIFNDNKMPSAKQNELAILNGLELNAMVETGTLVKVFGGQY
jgi:predicted Zn-dependent protease